MYIFGRNPVLEALKAEQEITKIFIRFGTHGDTVRDIMRRAKTAHIPVSQLDRQKFDRLGAGQAAQGVAALVEDVATVDLADLLAISREQDPPFFVALDSITDPHNVGAIIRSAECTGAHGVILPKHDSASITDVVVKASAGAVSHIPVARVGNLHQALEELKRNGIWVAGLAGEGDTDLLQFDGFRPLCLVIGSEGKGLRPVIRSACDILIRIPMWGHIDSLNASVAAALAMYEVRRRRL
jgi:23S rRNA (guanosine2251-2'-O)-methyltransferase